MTEEKIGIVEASKPGFFFETRFLRFREYDFRNRVFKNNTFAKNSKKRVAM